MTGPSRGGQQLEDLMKKLKKMTYLRVLIVLVSFMVMVFLSNMFVTNMIHGTLESNTANTLDVAATKIENNLNDIRLSLNGFALTLQNMISHDYSIEAVRQYNREMAQYFFFSLNPYSFSGLFGYFEYLDEPVMVESYVWDGSGYNPTTRPWYVLANQSHEKIIETISFPDPITGKMALIYSRCVHHDNGERMATIGIRVQMIVLEKIISEISIGKGSYGILLSSDNTVLVHPDESFVGKNADDLVLQLSEHLECCRGSYKFEGVNHLGESVIVIGRELSNGWNLAIVTPHGPYYENSRTVLLVMVVMGLLFSALLIVVLVKIDMARTKADIESQNKSAFLANMSHEIRTPLNVIIGMSSIGRSAPDPKKKDHCFTKIDEASNHLLGVVNDVLDLSKIEAGKLTLTESDFSFPGVINRVVNIVNYKIESKGQTLTVNVSADVPEFLRGDDLRLAQVITNLVGNANKFTPEKGNIVLSAGVFSSRNGVYIIQISVKDDGIGIDAVQQTKLFQSFEQATASTFKQFGGTGLGLAISKKIVELMGGRIWVESEAGKGATFHFTVVMEEGKPEEVVDEDDTLPDFTGKRILLAEDIEINREIVMTLLEPTGVKIDCAVNGLEAVTMASKKYDLVLMDINMPEMGGLEATRRIRKFDPSVPIIAMTANVFKNDVDEYLATGMNGFVGKPIDMKRVIEKLRIYLKP